MNIQYKVQLQTLNTLRLNVIASHYVQVSTLQELIDALDYARNHQLQVMILSGGSNMLLPQQLNALVIQMNIQGIDVLEQDELSAIIRVGAGQNWHEFVLWTTAHHFYGLQNLALIPGLVGASPVQNIGAYGVEVGEFIAKVEVYDRLNHRTHLLDAADCHFSYRHSIFKDEPERYVITHVHFRLVKKPNLKLGYGDLKQAVADEQTPENLQVQVIKIRQSKLPDPSEFPNAGSFFKNPVVDHAVYEELAKKFPNLPHYPQPNHQVKLAAGWLIEQAGWKGKRLGAVGMFHKQALVLVNYADACLADVQNTYRAVQLDVFNKFQICLEPEPVLFQENGAICAHTSPAL